MLKISDNAAKQIMIQSKEQDTGDMVLRIAAKTNQDGSFEYGMGFDDTTDQDIKIKKDDIIIAMDPQSAELLEDATMDFVELDDGNMHFIFSNPLDKNYMPPKKN